MLYDMYVESVEGMCTHTYIHTYIHTYCTCVHVHITYAYVLLYYINESFSARVGEVTHPKLPIYSLEIYYNSKL